MAFNAKFDVGCMLKYMPKSATTGVHYNAMWAKTYDPMLSIAHHTKGKYVSLETAAGLAGLSVKKSGDGLQAIKDFWGGRYGELAAYCADDVDLLREVDAVLKAGGINPPSATPVVRVPAAHTAPRFSRSIATQCGSGKIERSRH